MKDTLPGSYLPARAGERYTTRLILLLALPVAHVREVVQKSRCTFQVHVPKKHWLVCCRTGLGNMFVESINLDQGSPKMKERVLGR